MDTIDDRLRQFEPIDLDDDTSFDASQADQLLKLFTLLAKGQWKTQKKADYTVQKVVDYLDEHGDRVTELKAQRAALEDREKQYQRVLLDILDLFGLLTETARRSDSGSFQSATGSLHEKLAGIVGKIGLDRIPAEGHAPDSLYHHVVDTADARTASEQGAIVEVVRPGYLLRGDVLRKADVIVAT